MVRHRHSVGTRLNRLNRAERGVREACAEAASTAELIEGLREPLNAALNASGMLLSATDPETTTLGTATLVEQLPESMATGWMRNEFLDDDFNKFSELHRSRTGVTTLHRATQGRPQLSPRYRRLQTAHGYGPELRTTFSQQSECWGVATVLRETGDQDFDDVDLEWMETLRPLIAAGIQRTTPGVTELRRDDGIPGVVALGPTGDVVSMTGEAGRLLADLWLCPFSETSEFVLPGEAYMIATLARARNERCPRAPAPMTRLRGRSGRWLTVRGDCTVTPDGDLSGIVLVIEPSRGAEIRPVVVAAAGLSARERDVLTELLNGQSTGEIAGRLFISQHTVRDHIKSILAKTDTSSRAELMSLLFQR